MWGGVILWVLILICNVDWLWIDFMLLNKFFVLCVLVLCMVMVLLGGVQVVLFWVCYDLMLVGMCGIWYLKIEVGVQQCVWYVWWCLVELDFGVLQIGDQNFMEWGFEGWYRVVFVVEVWLKWCWIWCLQGFLDVYLYEVFKVLEIYVFEFCKDELYWFRRVVDVVMEWVEILVYVCCVQGWWLVGWDCFV